MKKYIVALLALAFCFSIISIANATPIKGDVYTFDWSIAPTSPDADSNVILIPKWIYVGNDNGTDITGINNDKVTWVKEIAGDGILTSGLWSAPGFVINFISVMTADRTIFYTANGDSGSWNTFDIPYRNNPHGLSHLELYGRPVPIPTAALLFGTGIIGLFGVKRKLIN